VVADEQMIDRMVTSVLVYLLGCVRHGNGGMSKGS
jgi:hypothetical protein